MSCEESRWAKQGREETHSSLDWEIVELGFIELPDPIVEDVVLFWS